jgi:hypothetical protein
MMDRTKGQARKFLLLLVFLLSLLTVGSLWFDLQGLDEQYGNLSAEVGRSFFQAVNVMRKWNLDQGGMYVRVTESSLPNTLLNDRLRDVSTTGGLRLTMVNHAHMTRLLSEMLTDQRGIRIHMSSMKPIRPENTPDPWERRALTRFENGSSEEFEVLREGNDSLFRYMAPLRVEPVCLTCHPGDALDTRHVRGGISVSFSYAPFLKLMRKLRLQTMIIHLMFFFVGVALIAVTGRKLVASIGALQDSLLRIKRLEGLLPICARCKKIRLAGTDQWNQNSWHPIEQYIQERTDAEFTHGLCPECAKALYPEMNVNRARGRSVDGEVEP